MNEIAKIQNESEPWDEQKERLELMAEENGKWDLSRNDRQAIAAALDRIARLEPILKEVVYAANKVKDWSGTRLGWVLEEIEKYRDSTR